MRRRKLEQEIKAARGHTPTTTKNQVGAFRMTLLHYLCPRLGARFAFRATCRNLQLSGISGVVKMCAGCRGPQKTRGTFAVRGKFKARARERVRALNR